MAAKTPAHIQAYVDVLGPDLAVEFFLKFGGSEIYLSSKPKRSMLLELTDAAKLARLSNAVGPGYIRVPIPKQWIAGVLSDRGSSHAQIARMLHVDQRTVLRWFSSQTDAAQLSLL